MDSLKVVMCRTRWASQMETLSEVSILTAQLSATTWVQTRAHVMETPLAVSISMARLSAIETARLSVEQWSPA